MYLQKKVIMLMLCFFFVYGLLTYGVQRMLILPSFYSLEQEETLKDMDRAVNAIQREIQHLATSATDWSVWDDTYKFVQDHNEAYRETNLNIQAISSLKVNILYLFDTAHQQVWGMAYDLDSQEEMEIPGLTEKLGAIHLSDPDSSVEGVLLTSKGPLLISAKPILTSNHQGPVRGCLILGRFLDDSSLATQARIGLRASVLGAGQLRPDIEAIVVQIKHRNDAVIRSDSEMNRVYQILPDINGNSALLLQVDFPRLITSRGKEAVTFSLLSLLGAGLVILVVLIVSLQKMVLHPIKRLTDHTVATGQRNDLSAFLDLDRNDEIGILSQEFNRMVERLAVARDSLMGQSYRSGMAEVAIGVLHNVGNVLNSVNVSCTLILDRLRSSGIKDVAKVANLLAAPEGGLCHFLTEDSRGKMIPAYLASLATELEKEQQVMLIETKSLQDKIEHIKEIVAMQQDISQVATGREILQPEQLMEDAVKLDSDELTQHNIMVHREYQNVPALAVDKHKVLQILINLINNAKHACNDSENQEKIITLRVYCPDDAKVRMEVADNGIGIASNNLTSIFQYGFTTRPSGHGFGLHSCVLAAREIGGSLEVHSDGPGCGATFSLDLPRIFEDNA